MLVDSLSTYTNIPFLNFVRSRKSDPNNGEEDEMRTLNDRIIFLSWFPFDSLLLFSSNILLFNS